MTRTLRGIIIKYREYNKAFGKYIHGELTLKQLKDFQSDPGNFQLERPGSNRGRKFERK